ncbi:hypothetical protein EC957_007258 [Mortierella hygrophila]|uniref:GH18 domain-containing protein n=1 Tax=Mortierella hygrophila TaxID=979708 RepID=A0A9P6EYM6_9FUNG|nr:hypothetical protein EC957_007258 [Mortierella hygrophila]
MKFSILSVAAAVVAIATAAPLTKRADSTSAVVGYWVPWGDVPVSALDMTKYTHINYGFGVMWKGAALPTTITIDRYYDGDNIQQLVTRGNAAGVPILISIGGWTGSQTFSTVAASAAYRKTWINNALVFVRQNTNGNDADNPNGWGMDGIDIDWEYPGREGAPCNVVSPQDSANYLQLLKELRAALDLEFPAKHKLITAAVRVQPFDGPGGSPMSNVAAYVPYFDFISVMAYDIMGSWSAVTGPNAPFGTPPAPGDPFGFVQAINSWSNAGWPAEKLVMGTAFYGRSLTANVNMDTQNPITQYVPFSPTVPKGGPSDSQEENFYCSEGTGWSGQWKWKELRAGPLASGPNSPAAGWTRHWDNQTQTPWLFQPSTKTYISYDDIQSLTVKVNQVKSLGLKGVMLWDASYDFNGELINVLNQVRGPTPTSTVTASPSSTIATTSVTRTTAVTTPPPSTTTTATSTATPLPGGPCVGVASWNSATTYATAGTKVTYGGYLYTNQWWTQGETPSAAAWGVWTQGAAC